jgi:hypothetical protein
MLSWSEASPAELVRPNHSCGNRPASGVRSGCKGWRSYSSEDSNRARRWPIEASWNPRRLSSAAPWWTPVDSPRLATDQQVGGSSPSERADRSWSEWVSSGQRSRPERRLVEHRPDDVAIADHLDDVLNDARAEPRAVRRTGADRSGRRAATQIAWALISPAARSMPSQPAQTRLSIGPAHRRWWSLPSWPAGSGRPARESPALRCK